MLPYKVIEIFKPKIWDAREIGKYLTNLTASLGYSPHIDPEHGPLKLTIKNGNWSSDTLHAEVRHKAFKTNQAEGWHYDGDTTPGSNPHCLICVWSTATPTEIRPHGSQKIYRPEPYEVVIFNNMECVHRRPPNAPKDRWTFRQRLSKEIGLYKEKEIKMVENSIKRISFTLRAGRLLNV